MTPTDPLTGSRVLIVDDQRMFVDALTRIVEDAGMVVHGVAGTIAQLEESLGSPGASPTATRCKHSPRSAVRGRTRR